jgi:hypothetical protein
VAKALLRQVLPLLAQVHAPRLVYSVPTDLGIVAQKEGDHATARMHFGEALAAARASGLRADEALALQNLACQALLEGDYPTAHALCEESLALARAVDDPLALAYPPRVLGWVSFLRGDVAASHQLLEEAVGCPHPGQTGFCFAASGRNMGDRTRACPGRQWSVRELAGYQ